MIWLVVIYICIVGLITACKVDELDKRIGQLEKNENNINGEDLIIAYDRFKPRG